MWTWSREIVTISTSQSDGERAMFKRVQIGWVVGCLTWVSPVWALEAHLCAVVGNQAITQGDVVRQVELLRQRAAATQHALPDASTLRGWALDALINRALQLQYAKAQGMQVPEGVFQRVLDSMAKQQGLSVTGLKQRWRKQGQSVRDQLSKVREDVMLMHLQHQSLASQVSVTPKQIHQAWMSQQIHVIDWVTQDRHKQANLRAQIKRGLSLKALSPALRATLQAKDLGWRTWSALPDAFVKALRAAPHRAALVGPVVAENGLHVLEVKGRKPEVLLTEAQVRARLLDVGIEQALPHWLDTLRQQSYVQRFACGDAKT